MLLTPAVLEKGMLMFPVSRFDNWMTGPDQLDMVNVHEGD